jgi:hypothetical protein
VESQKRIESEIITAILGGPWAPPVDLFNIAAALGVNGIEKTEFRDGFTDFRFSRAVVYLNGKEAGPRMRFVFAHELAHVMLRTPQAMYLIKMRGCAGILHDEEAFASRIAAELLIPGSWIEKIASRVTLARLMTAAHMAEVSLSILVAQMALAGIDVALLRWRQGNGSWRVIDRPGVPYCLDDHIVPSEQGKVAIESLDSEESRITVDGRVGGRNAKISGYGLRYGKYALQLIEPSRAVCFAGERILLEA